MRPEGPGESEERGSSSPSRDQTASSGTPSHRQRITRREREIPRESAIWLTAGWAVLAFAASVVLAAMTLSGNVGVSAPVLWTIAICSLVLATACFLAHWDVNRGRKVRHSEIEEEKEDLSLNA